MEDKRLAILLACRHLLEEGHKITMDKVAVVAGVAKGTVYLYFESKQELIMQTFIASIEEISDVMHQTAVSSTGTSFDRLTAMVEVHYEMVRGKMLLLQRLFSTEPGIFRRPVAGPPLVVMRAIERVQACYIDVLTDGIKCGEFRPHNTQIIATAIMAVIQNFSVGDIYWPHDNQGKVIGELLQFVLQGITLHGL
ncbi:MAG: TetR/AcrR family transcriptional regulator [Firmicutes bacterium]|nr:TetR/AcrR family transcriptional regulator [Bacillota bacterium]